MVHLKEVHGFYYELKAIWSANVCYCITADQTLPLHFFSADFIFQIMKGSKENIHHFLSSVKITLILTFRIISLKISRTTVHTTHTDANPDGKRCLIASKLIKEPKKHI
jgi:hypothetical protein